MSESANTEKETLLEKIVSMGADVSASNISVRVAYVLVMGACLSYSYALMAGFTSKLMFPVLFTILVGNQIFATRTRIKQKKLDEMKNTYENKFGAIPSPH